MTLEEHIAALGRASRLIVRMGSGSALSRALGTNERVEALMIGQVGRDTGVLAATNRGLIFASPTQTKMIAYEHITSLDYNRGLTWLPSGRPGSITVHSAGENFTARKLRKHKSDDFVAVVRERLAARREQS